jgi:hypothetical protein
MTVTTAHARGDIGVPLAAWIRPGAGLRRDPAIVAAPGISTGREVSFAAIPLEDHDPQEARELHRQVQLRCRGRRRRTVNHMTAESAGKR